MVDPGININNLISSANAVPSLDPEVHVANAQVSPDPVTAATNAQAIAGFGQATTRANQLKSMSPAAQTQAWEALSANDQKQLQAAGYAGPPAAHKSKSLWGHLTGALGDVGHAIETGGQDVLNAAQSPLRAVEHLSRAARVVGESGMTPSEQEQYARMSNVGTLQHLGTGFKLFAASFKNVLQPHEWAQAWDQTEHGEKTFDPGAVRYLTDKYGAPTVDQAKQIVYTNFDINKLRALPQQLQQRYQQDQDLRAAVQQLSASKMSWGRSFTGEKFMADHPALGTTISGGVDGTIDFIADPLNIGLASASDALKARYVVGSGADVYRLAGINPETLADTGKGDSNVRSAIDQAARYITAHWVDSNGTAHTGDLQGLVNRFTMLRKAQGSLGPLIADGTVHDRGTFVKWMADQVDKGLFASGDAGKISREGTQILHAGTISDAEYAAKMHLQSTIDWAAQNVPTLLGGGAARSALRLSQLIPRGDFIVPSSIESPTQFRQMVGMWFNRPYADELANLWDLGTNAERKALYKSTLQQMADRSNPKMAAYWDRLIDRLDHVGDLYSTALGPGGDRMAVNGVTSAYGIGANQVMGKWELPDPRVMQAAKYKVTLGDKAIGLINNDGIDAFMQQGWKPLQLMRLGFAPRVAGEELFGAMLRDGFANLARSRLATSATKGTEPILPWHPLHSTLAALTDHLSEGTIKDILSGNNVARDLWTNIVTDNYRRAFRGFEGRLAGPDMMQYARELWDGGIGKDAFAEHLTAIHQGGLDYLDSGGNQANAMRKGLENRPAYLKFTGDYKEVKQGDRLFMQVYKKNLEDIGNDYLFRAALPNFGDREQQVQDVIDKINAPQAEVLRKEAVRYSHLRDGRVVGAGATQEEAVRDWANAVVDHVNGYIKDSDLATKVRSGKAPTVAELEQMPLEKLPLSLHGQETVPTAGPNFYQRLLQNGFHEMVGRPMNWLAREPMFLHNYALARGELAAQAELFGDDVAQALAVQRAVNRTIPFIHDPELRSQMSINVRNLMPFEFAQEQFYKRWARTFNYAPDAFRKAALIAAGLQHSGLTHVDANGNEYFNYPLIGQIEQSVITPVLSHIGIDAQVPVMPGFSGQIKNISPGISHIGPSFGPIVTLPLKELGNLFPELKPVDVAAEGQSGANTSMLSQILPSTIYRFAQVFEPSRDLQAQYSTAMAMAIKNLEYTGHGFPENGTDGEKQLYIDRLTNWTRIAVGLRALLGFVGPTAPSITPGRQDIPKRFAQLLQAYGDPQQAAAELLREDPNATPYTVFASSSPGKASIPATQKTLDLITGNMGFFSQYTKAGGWLIPTSDATGKFSDSAYLMEMAMGMRDRRLPADMLDAVLYARDAPQFFKNLQNYDRMKLQYQNNYAAKTKLEQAWQDWSANYFKMHPAFGDQFQKSSSAVDRADIVTEMQKALADPALPKSATSDAIGGLVRNYLNFQAMQSKYKALHTSAGSRQLAALENAFTQWADTYVKQHPEAVPFYQRIVQPDVGGPAAQAEILAGDQATADQAAQSLALPVAG